MAKQMSNELLMPILIRNIKIATEKQKKDTLKLNEIATYEYVCDNCGSFDIELNIADTYNCCDCGVMFHSIIGKAWRVKDV